MSTLKIFTPLVVALALVGCNNADQADTTAAAPVANNTAPANTTANNTATATAANMTPDQHKDAREEIMESWGKASKAMGGMIKNPSSFDAATFKVEAEKLSQDPWGHFGAGTEGGESKPTVWSDAAGFQQEIDKFKTASNALMTAATTATSVDGVKAQFGDVGASCKSCHDKFKED